MPLGASGRSQSGGTNGDSSENGETPPNSVCSTESFSSTSSVYSLDSELEGLNALTPFTWPQEASRTRSRWWIGASIRRTPATLFVTAPPNGPNAAPSAESPGLPPPSPSLSRTPLSAFTWITPDWLLGSTPDASPPPTTTPETWRHTQPHRRPLSSLRELCADFTARLRAVSRPTPPPAQAARRRRPPDR